MQYITVRQYDCRNYGDGLIGENTAYCLQCGDDTVHQIAAYKKDMTDIVSCCTRCGKTEKIN